MCQINKKTSIYTIAQKANVSTATVSKVINNKKGVSENTRLLIQKLIEESNFKPRISNTISDTVGIFLSFNTENPLSNNYTRKIMEGIGDVVFPHNMNVMIIPVEYVPRDLGQFSFYCTKRNICGGVFLNLHGADSYVYDFKNVLPIVIIGTDSPNNTTTVRIDNLNSSYDLTHYLINEGHRQILFVADHLDMYDHTMRLNGFKKALEECEINLERKNILDITHYSDIELMQLLKLRFTGNGESPTAIFACDDRLALKIISVLDNCNISVPEDVSIVGFDDSEYARHITPSLTTVRQPVLEMGRIAAKLLIELIENNTNIENNKVVMNCQMIIRNSVKNIST